MLCSATIEASIFLSQVVWLLRTRNIRQRAKEAELEWDEFPEAQAWQEDRWRLPSIRRNVGTVDEVTENSAEGTEQTATQNTHITLGPIGDTEQCKQV